MASLGPGFKVGHVTDAAAATGCTVILPPPGNVTSCEIRGSSPGSRELELLHPDRRLTEIHALLLTGGSAFGLAAAQGVVAWLEERAIGYATPLATIPIVPAAVIFDLGVAGRRPGPEDGYAACEAAAEGEIETGRVGAGTGATVGKWAGLEHRVPGGLGVAEAERDGVRVHALAVVNAVGDVLAADGSVLAGTTAPAPSYVPPLPAHDGPPANTVLVALTLRAGLDKREVRWLAARAADGVTRTVKPAHTRYDGDVAFAIAAPPQQGEPEPNLDLLGYLATEAVEEAVRGAVS